MNEELASKSPSPSLLERVDVICDRFERAWLQGERPLIEDYLTDVEASEQVPLVRELLKVELEYRSDAKEEITLEQYQQRFARYPSLLPEIACCIEDLRKTARPVDSTEHERASSIPTGPPSSSESAPPARPTAQATSRYTQKAFHAEGGLGEVYKAYDVELHREVALKRIKEEHADNPTCRRDFLREAEITGKLEHPGVVPIYGLIQGPDGKPSYAMRFIEGESLKDAIHKFHEADKGKRDPGERAVALRQLLTRFIAVCNTLAFAHNRGIIHRDLKPANIMLGKYGETLVVDWGLARPFARTENERANGEDILIPTPKDAEAPGATKPGQIKGTFSYMSPEQAEGRWDLVGPASDIYSLGATLYELLTGVAPVRGRGKIEVLSKAQRAEFLPPRSIKPDIAKPLEAICLKAMKRDRADRYQTADLMGKDLDLWLADEPVAAYRDPWHLRLRRFSRRHRTLVTSLASLVLALALVGGAGAWGLVQWRGATDVRIQLALNEASTLRAQAQVAPVGEQALARWGEAEAAARRLDDLIDQGFPSSELRQQVRDFNAALSIEAGAARQQAEEAKRDQQFLNLLADVRTQKEDEFDKADTDGGYRVAFVGYGLDVDALTIEAAAEHLVPRPQELRVEVAAALDDWALERRRLQQAPAQWQRLVALARAVDRDPWRTALRDLDYTAIGKERRKLLDVADTAQVSELSPASVLLLSSVLRTTGEAERAEAVLREAQRLHPTDVWLNYDLAQTLAAQPSPPWNEVVRFYTAARSLRPEIGHALGHALEKLGKKDEAVAVFAELTRLRPANPRHHNCLGAALKDKKQLDEAIWEYRTAIDLDPNFAVAHYNLGIALRDKKQLDYAIQEYRRAIDLDPKFAPAHTNLGVALRDKGELDEAIREYRTAIDLDPNLAVAHYNLGIDLRDKKQLDEAIREYRTAIELDPKLGEAHNNLGIALSDKNQLDEAIREYRTAIDLDPKDATAHNNLGVALRDKGELEEAIREYRTAIDLDPKDARPHNGLGHALADKKQLDEAIREYRTAIDLDPKDAKAHHGLGTALREKKQLDEAIREYRTAIDLDPKDALPHIGLGNTLRDKGQIDEAIREVRMAIELQPDFADAHCNLGLLLVRQGAFGEALAELRRGHELGSKTPGWNYPSAAWVRAAEGLVQLERRLPDILVGKEKPGNNTERLVLAHMCQQHKKLYAASARFYDDAFDQNAKLADDMQQAHRYNAACAAALAGCGLGNDADKLDDKDLVRLRNLARAWLRADLEAWASSADQGKPDVLAAAVQALQHWQADPDLTGVRDKDPLAKLPEAEQEAWRKLWADVEELLKKVQEAKSAGRP